MDKVSNYVIIVQAQQTGVNWILCGRQGLCITIEKDTTSGTVGDGGW